MKFSDDISLCDPIIIMRRLNRIVLSSSVRKTKPKALSAEEFKTHSKTLFSTVEKAMIQLSEVSQDETSQLKIQLSPSSVFKLAVDEEQRTVVMQSPISGEKTYHYNRLSKRWEDTTDGHDIQGLLTRDFMRLSTGVPQF